MIKPFQLDSSPFIVGLVSHPDLEAAHIPPLVQAAVSCLLEIKQRLPDTDVRVMLDARNDASLAIARAALGMEISVDALVVAPAPGLTDLVNHPQVRWIALGAEQSRGPDQPHQPLQGALADVLVRRASLLLACWDGNSSKLPNDTADQVFRFLGAGCDQNEGGNTIETSAVVDDLEVTARLVSWVPIQRGGQDVPRWGRPTLLSAVCRRQYSGGTAVDAVVVGATAR